MAVEISAMLWCFWLERMKEREGGREDWEFGIGGRKVKRMVERVLGEGSWGGVR